ncbi:MAG: triose-phosphate isomerase [Pseudomonadota bacterium]
MTPNIRPLVAGNWKMNGTAEDLPTLRAIADGVAAHRQHIDATICVPATLCERAVRISDGTPLVVGAQDCHRAENGAHTGDVSANMIADCGAQMVIVGHSERRADHDETDIDVMAKAQAAVAAQLTAIVCVGETREEREAGQATDVVGRQLAGSLFEDAASKDVVIAYEPVWAIGTGLVPSEHDIDVMHAFIREQLVERFGADGSKFRILYGGSLKPSNAEQILAVPNVDGGLIGGASLKSENFLAICQTAADLADA